MSGYWLILIISLLFLAVIPAKIAEGKGKDFLTWYIYGFFLWFFAMIHSIVLPENRTFYSKEQEINESKLVATSNIDYVNVDCPVEILSAYINKNERTGLIYCDIQFRNLNRGRVKSMKLAINCFDSFSKPVISEENNKIEVLIQDIEIEKNDTFGMDNHIQLTGYEATRKVQIEIVNVLFDDGNTWGADSSNTIMCLKNEMKTIGDDLHKLKKVAGEDAVRYPKEEHEFWYCVCGRINREGLERCARCNRVKNEVFDKYSKDNVDISYREMVSNEEMELEQIVKEEAQRKKRKIKYICLATITVVVLISTFSVIKFYILPEISVNKQYNYAMKLATQGDYREAVDAFSTIKDYKDVNEKVDDTHYKYGIELLNKSLYEDALKEFEKAKDYKDTNNYILEAYYRIASSYLQKGKYTDALATYEKVKDYKDTKEKVTECHYQLGLIYMYKNDYNNALTELNLVSNYMDATQLITKLNDLLSVYNQEKDLVDKTYSRILNANLGSPSSYYKNADIDAINWTIEQSKNYSTLKTAFKEDLHTLYVYSCLLKERYVYEKKVYYLEVPYDEAKYLNSNISTKERIKSLFSESYSNGLDSRSKRVRDLISSLKYDDFLITALQ